MYNGLSLVRLKRRRWPVKYKERIFNNRLELLDFCFRTHSLIPFKGFLHSNYYFCRIALEEKFQREFTYREVKRILNDKTWQWRTSSQSYKNKL